MPVLTSVQETDYAVAESNESGVRESWAALSAWGPVQFYQIALSESDLKALVGGKAIVVSVADCEFGLIIVRQEVGAERPPTTF